MLRLFVDSEWIITSSFCVLPKYYLKVPNYRLLTWCQNTCCLLEKAIFLTDLCQKGKLVMLDLKLLSLHFWLLYCVLVYAYLHHSYIYEHRGIFIDVHIYIWMMYMICMINNISYGTLTWQYVFIVLLFISNQHLYMWYISHFLLETFRKGFLCTHLVLNFKKN